MNYRKEKWLFSGIDSESIYEMYNKKVIVPLMLFSSALIVIVIGMVIWIGNWQTSSAQRIEESLALSAINQRLSSLIKTVDDYATWDDANNKISDLEWANENIAIAVLGKYQFTLTAVIDSHGKVIFSSFNGERHTETLDDLMGDGLTSILEKLENSKTASGILIIQDQPFLTVASEIRPFSTLKNSSNDHDKKYLIFAEPMGQEQLSSLSKIYNLPALRVTNKKPSPPYIPLKAINDEHTFFLSWERNHLGKDMSSKVVPILLVVFVILFFISILSLHSIRRLSEIIKESKKKSFLDSLTNLPNRSLLLITLDTLTSREKVREFAVAYLDLDGFKTVNDNFGHYIGDEVLKETSQRILSIINPGDMLSRQGGDEFVLIYSGGIDKLKEFSERLIAEVKKPIKREGFVIQIGVSIGIALYPNHALTATELLKKADIALYQSKNFNKGTVQFYDEKNIMITPTHT